MGDNALRLNLYNVVMISLIAYIGVWLIDKGLNKVGAGNFSINSKAA